MEWKQTFFVACFHAQIPAWLLLSIWFQRKLFTFQVSGLLHSVLTWQSRQNSNQQHNFSSWLIHDRRRRFGKFCFGSKINHLSHHLQLMQCLQVCFETELDCSFLSALHWQVVLKDIFFFSKHELQNQGSLSTSEVYTQVFIIHVMNINVLSINPSLGTACTCN